MRKNISVFFLCLLMARGVAAQFDKNLPVIIVPEFKKDTISILDFGAVPDGHTLNTKAINAAIDMIHKKGGGVVLVPAGLWLSGPVELKNNVNLHLVNGATL